MSTQTSTAGITFVVQPVERATTPLPTCKTNEALNRLLNSKIEGCCDFTADCIQKVSFHPLLAAAHFAFSQHRPLVLSPDMIWVAVLQGVARHVRNQAERLRDRFVGHQGKLEICVERDDLLPGSPENAWDGVIHDLSLAIKKHLGPRYDELISDFSTTGPVERTACEVALLDTFQPYFEYRVYCICGIPEITLEGATDDWQRLKDKVEALVPYDLDWWLPHVRQVCDQFVRASQGDIDAKHWRDIYKRQDAYGWDVVNGWLVKLVPYLKNNQTGNFTVRNPLLDDLDSEVSTTMLPSGVSQVPFRHRWRGQANDAAMEFLGGFVGVTQDASTLALRPKLGWAVRQGSELDRLFAKLSKHKPAPPLDAPEFDARIAGFNIEWRCELPGDFLSFYKHCNGVGLFGDACRFRPLEAVEPVEGITTRRSEDYPAYLSSWDSGPWVRFGDLADGSFVVIELRHTYKKGWKVVRVGSARDEFSPIVAWSLAEFLDRALGSGGRLERLQPPP
jgi:Domain of unknown function (DUF4419)/SMI1 / KNR4 family (SUKH-1)